MARRHAKLALLLALGSCARGPVATEDKADADIGAIAGSDSDASAEAGQDSADGAIAANDSGQGGTSGGDGGGSNGDDGGDSTGLMSDAGDGAQVAPVCASTNACTSAQGLPAVAGDTASAVEMTSGTSSRWVSLTVSDTGGVGTNQPITARITLTSQDGANYDLFVLQPVPDGGHSKAPSDCSATPKISQNMSGDDVVALSWNDEQNLLGEDAGDGLVISIEVRHISGPCGSWTLKVEGNQ